MGARITMPQRKNYDQELFKEGGTIVGGVIGGISGAAAGGVGAAPGAVGGAMLGRNIGGMVGGIASPDRASPQAIGGQGVAVPGRSSQPGLLDTAAAGASAYQGVSNFNPGGQGAGLREGTGNVPQSTPMQRRMDTQQSAMALADADTALGKLPKQYQDEYGPAIRQARMADRYGRTS